MATHQQFSPNVNREIRTIVVDERQRKKYRLGSDSPNAVLCPQTRWVQTTVDDDNPSYPVAPANKFVIQLGDWSAFDDTAVGQETITFEPYEPAETYIAYSHVGWLPENIVLRATLQDGFWHIFPDQFGELKAVVTNAGGIAAGGSGEVTIWLAPTLGADPEETGWTVTAHLNWMHGGQNVDEAKQVLIRWFQDEARWVIVEREC